MDGLPGLWDLPEMGNSQLYPLQTCTLALRSCSWLGILKPVENTTNLS